MQMMIIRQECVLLSLTINCKLLTGISDWATRGQNATNKFEEYGNKQVL